jgi:hypothetical protein
MCSTQEHVICRDRSRIRTQDCVLPDSGLPPIFSKASSAEEMLILPTPRSLMTSFHFEGLVERMIRTQSLQDQRTDNVQGKKRGRDSWRLPGSACPCCFSRCPGPSGF